MKFLLSIIFIITVQNLLGQDTVRLDINDKLVVSHPNWDHNENQTVFAIQIDTLKSWINTRVEILDSKNSQLMTVLYNNNDTLYTEYYCSNGQLLSKDISHEILGWIYSEEYYENGQKHYSYFPNSNELIQTTSYFENGTPERIYSYCCHGTFVGDYKEFHENGQLKLSGQFESVPKGEMNHFHPPSEIGIWKYYDENGVLTREEIK